MSLASLQEKLKKLKMQRVKERQGPTDPEELTDTIDHRNWVKRIEQLGNPATEWLLYTNYVLQYVQFDTEDARNDFICNMFSKAVKAISSTGLKCESYARLFVNYANFVSQIDEDDARDLFYTARINLRRYAIVHIYAAQFEFLQGNKDKCRKIFEKAFEINAEPRELLDIANKKFLLGHQQLISEEELTNLTGLAPTSTQTTQDLSESRLSGMNISLDSGMGKSETTDNTTDRSLKFELSRRCSSLRTASNSSDDTAPLGVNLDDAFTRPSARKAASAASVTSSLIKPPPARRELIPTASESNNSRETPLASKGTGSGCSLLDNYSLPSKSSPTEGTVSFNFPEKRKREMSGALSDDCDTVPLSLDASHGSYDRPLRYSHSTPDCKNPSVISLSTRKRRFVGQARRTLETVRESGQKTVCNGQVTEKDGHTHEGIIPPMPNLDASRTQEMSSTDTHILDRCNLSVSCTLTDSKLSAETHSGSQETLTNSHQITNRSQKNRQERQTSSECGTSTPVQPLIEIHPPQERQPLCEAPVSAAQVSQEPVPPASRPAPQEQKRTCPAPQTNHVHTPHYQEMPPEINMACSFTPMAKQQIALINGKQYSILNCIGRGGTSSVYDVLDADNVMRAVKIIDMAGADEATIQSYKNEIALLQRLQKSDRVITMFDHEYNVRRNKLYVVMERGDTDLASLFARDKLNENKVKYFWQEMLSAVQVLHSEGIIHTDLKPANFLLVAGHLKLIDFGIAKAIQQDMTSVVTDQQVGTLNFMSPEALMAESVSDEVDENGQLRRKLKIGYKSDVWSLGCILYRMVYGCTPFQSIRNQLQKMKAIINPNHSIKFPEIPDRHLWDVIKVCLVRNPHDRPSIEDLLAHPYLKSLDCTTPTPKGNPQEALLKMMQQLVTASPGSLSSVRQNAKSFLAQIQDSSTTQGNPGNSEQTNKRPNQDVQPKLRSSANVRHISRAPLATVDPNENRS